MRTSIRSLSNVQRITAAVTASVFAFATLTAPSARADENAISPNGKGITGGALLGGELVVIVEAIAGVHSGVAYAVGGILGAGAGGVGGYFVEQNSSDGRAPVYMLAIGVGMIIPALVLSLNATRYMPTEGATEDHAPTNAPAANPGAPGASSVGPAAPAPLAPPLPAGGATAPAPAPTPAPPVPPPAAAPAPAPLPKTGMVESAPHLSLFDVNGGGMHLGIPVPEVRQTFSASELRQYGVAQQTEVRMPIVKIAF